MRWRWASASEIGTSHIKLGTRKQDALASFLADDTASTFCAIACDGAGSAAFGGEGASIVCRTFSVALKGHFRETSAFPADDDIWEWLDLARDRLSLAAGKRGVDRRAFASTLVLLVARKVEQLVIHVGDGAIVGRDVTGAWQTLSWPENGEYASTTYFVSDDPAPKARIARTNHNMDGFAVFSDGIEDLALDLVAITPHVPFFRTMIAPLDKLDAAGRDAALSKALGSFLNSPRVCEKTDDDKSLILVSAQ